MKTLFPGTCSLIAIGFVLLTNKVHPGLVLGGMGFAIMLVGFVALKASQQLYEWREDHLRNALNQATIQHNALRYLHAHKAVCVVMPNKNPTYLVEARPIAIDLMLSSMKVSVGAISKQVQWLITVWQNGEKLEEVLIEIPLERLLVLSIDEIQLHAYSEDGIQTSTKSPLCWVLTDGSEMPLMSLNAIYAALPAVR